MAPEQIEGLEADARTDIFAFRAVLFEMLGGRPAFERKTRAQRLGAILKDEPPPVSSLVLSQSSPKGRGTSLVLVVRHAHHERNSWIASLRHALRRIPTIDGSMQ